jgi:elongator complex protein 1
LWEKNGLRHGEFDLYGGHHQTEDESKVTVHDMKWNSNSKVMAIEISERWADRDLSDQVFLLIVSRSNYKWYLKSKLPLRSRCVGLQWNSRRKYDLQYVSADGEFAFLSFKLEFQVGCYTAIHGHDSVLNTALAAVIDGSTLHCTPLSKYCTPPPMAHFQAQFSGVIVDVCFAPDIVCALVMNGRKYLAEAFAYNWDDGAVGDKILAAALENELSFPRLPHVEILADKSIKITFVSGSGKDTKLHEEIYSSSVKQESKCLPLEFGVALNWVKGQTKDQGKTTECLYFGFNNEVVYPATVPDHPALPADVQNVNRVIDFYGSDGQMHIAILTEGNQLFIDSGLVAENCTSLAYAGGFFLFTVMTQNMFDMLYLYPVGELLKAPAAVRISSYQVARQVKSSTGKDHSMRNIERGSDIICLTGQRLVMEMPRGNLEVIYPKLLMFYEIQRLIKKERNFMAAYKEIRRHKLDMNLIVDVCPKIFKEEVENGNIMKTFRKTDDINLILNSLEKEVSPDLSYITSSEELQTIKNFVELVSRPYGENKVNYICHLLRDSMNKEQDHFILSIIMTYTRQQPPQLEDALQLVQNLQKDEDELCDVIAAPHLNPVSSHRL